MFKTFTNRFFFLCVVHLQLLFLVHNNVTIAENNRCLCVYTTEKDVDTSKRLNGKVKVS